MIIVRSSRVNTCRMLNRCLKVRLLMFSVKSRIVRSTVVWRINRRLFLKRVLKFTRLKVSLVSSGIGRVSGPRLMYFLSSSERNTNILSATCFCVEDAEG